MVASKKLYIGSDHAGYALKQKLKRWLRQHDVIVEDCGNLFLDPNDDYPDFAIKVTRKVTQHNSKGILLCGSAQGMCVTANKVQGIRAIVPYTLKEARLAREHLDANILCLSGWYTPYHTATKMIELFLTTPFSNAPRHIRRIHKIQKIEQRK